MEKYNITFYHLSVDIYFVFKKCQKLVGSSISRVLQLTSALRRLGSAFHLQLFACLDVQLRVGSPGG